MVSTTGSPAPGRWTGSRWSGGSLGLRGRGRCWSGPAFILLCYLLMICIVSLLSRQPLYNERMNFPLLRVPILMQEALDEDRLGAFLTHRYLLAGLMVPVCLHLINGLSFYNLPSLRFPP